MEFYILLHFFPIVQCWFFFLLDCQIETQNDLVTLQHRDTQDLDNSMAPAQSSHTKHSAGPPHHARARALGLPGPKKGVKNTCHPYSSKYLFGIAQQSSHKACGAGGGSARWQLRIGFPILFPFYLQQEKTQPLISFLLPTFCLVF